MVDDIDIYRAAKLLIDEHGLKGASDHAADRSARPHGLPLRMRPVTGRLPAMRPILAIFLGLAAFAATPATAQTIAGEAFAMDGDNIGMIGADGALINIRLWGIAAPEMADANGWFARLAMDGLLARHGQPVTCEQVNTDRHKRPVATCAAADGTDLGLAMIETGWAAEYRKFTRDVPALAKLRPAYAEAEARAAAAHLGRWAGPADSYLPVAISAALSALLTGLAGLGLWHYQQARHTRALCVALACEIDRIHAHIYDELDDAVPDDTWEPTGLPQPRDVNDSNSRVFESAPGRDIYAANLGRLGDLPPRLAEDMVQFHAELDRLVTFAADVRNRVSMGGPEKMFRERARLAGVAKALGTRLRGRWAARPAA